MTRRTLKAKPLTLWFSTQDLSLPQQTILRLNLGGMSRLQSLS
jgi:hypothetical protein